MIEEIKLITKIKDHLVALLLGVLIGFGIGYVIAIVSMFVPLGG
jgi:hypothetical protein